MDHDHRQDIAVQNYQTNDISLFFALGNGTFRSQMKLPTDSMPACLRVDDFNEDNRSDLAVVNYLQATVGIFLNIY
mgnify:FL=1